MTWILGQSLRGGKYIIERPIGRGLFGITYRAKNLAGNQVAIKTLNQTLQQRPDFAKLQQLFRDEAFRLAECSHPHIVRIDEVFEEENLCCMVMEYITGENLAHLVQQRGMLPEGEALLYIQQIGDGLNLVHNSGFLHGDIKPANIMLRNGQSDAVLIDFCQAHKYIRNLSQTKTGVRPNNYAPIEYYDQRAELGAHTDIYALAATLYGMLTGQAPTIAPGRVAGTAIRPPKQLNPRISERVNYAILKGMALKREDRPKSVADWFGLFGSRLAMNVGSSFTSQENSEPNFYALPPDNSNMTMEIDYSRLEALLAQSKWKEADEETKAVMVKIAGRQKEGWLRVEDIKNFPCGNLRTINILWVRYSHGRFGFSVQKHIWETVGGKPNADLLTYQRFCDRVGWRVHDSPVWWSQLSFSIDAPVGHLPCKCVEGDGWIGRGWGVDGNLNWCWIGSLCSRVEGCGLYK